MIVNKSQAIGLNEIGFDEPCMGAYPIDLDELLIKPARKWNSTTNMYISAPDIDKAIRWMRDVKGVHVWVSQSCLGYYYYHGVYNTDMVFESQSFRRFNPAQSAGLDAAIEYVKKQMI